LVTEAFWPQGEFVAKAEGMPDIPRIQLPHPVAGSGHEQMLITARTVRDVILASLRGEPLQ
jgi:hypothetical protein